MIQLNYLEKLLGGVDVEWLPLGNLAEIGTGKSGKMRLKMVNIHSMFVQKIY